MSFPHPRALLLTGLLALPATLHAQNELVLDEAALPEGVTITLEVDGETHEAASLSIHGDAEPHTVESRLGRLEQNMERQQELLERVVERLEAVPLASPGAPPSPATPAIPDRVDAPLLAASAADDAGLDIAAEAVASFGGPVHVSEGEVVEEAVAFGSPVRVSGTVQGDAVSFGEDILVTSTGHVMGDAVSFGGRVQVEPGGQVEGDRVALASDEAPTTASGLAMLAEKGSDWMHNLVRRAVVLLCLAGIGVLLLGLFPDKVRNTSRGLERHPIRYGIAGLLLTGTGLAVALLLGITIIGLPLSGFVLLLLGLAWLLGFVALGQTVGDMLPVPTGARGKAGAFLVGVCLLGALSFVPYLGKLLLVLTLFPCVGAAVGTRFGASER